MHQIFSAKALDLNGVVRLSDTVRDLVRAYTVASRGRCSASKGGGLGGGAARDLIRAATGSWSPL